MGKKQQIIVLCAIMCAVVLVVGGLFVYNRTCLVDRQNEALAELERNAGQYDEQSIVLYGTSKAKAEELAQLYGAELRITNDGRFARLTLPEGTTIRDVYAREESLTHIDEMAADYQMSISEESEEENAFRLPVRPQYTVSDTDYELQTYLDYLNMGNVYSSYTGSGITVAVIDTGIDTDHPEFAGRISAYSYNATEDKIVKDYGNDWSLIEDEQGHGTAVAGVIAASMNSGNVVGIAPDVQILVIKAECDENGNFSRTSDLVFGLYYAIERDVDVVNMSFGTRANVFGEAAQLAVDSDIICVASAGNESTSVLTYPAADENVIGVGALGEGWELAEYSNYGENTDLVAPGTTYTCQMGGGYQTINGTSFSSPIVAATIALYKQTDKYTTYDEVTEILYASSYDLGDLGRDWYYGFGALDISAFLLEERGTITYDMLTDELENEEGLFIRGHALQELPEPERLYAVFDGWYYDDTFTQECSYYEDEFYGDLTLYAKWVNEDDGIPYTYVVLDDGTVEIRSYTGRRRYITIPEKIDGRTVSSIGDFAFQGETRLREVHLPSGLKHIGLSAFEGCSNLISIQIPAGVTEIEEKAFKDNVKLSTVAFLGSSKLQTIGDFAFSNCGRLERIELPATVTSVNGSAFFGATQLHTIAVQSGNNSFSSHSGVLYNYTGSTLVAFPAAFATSYTLPETTLTVGDYAFGFAQLKLIDLANVQTIGTSGLAYSKLQTLTIPDGVTAIGKSAFASNESLSSVTLGRGLSAVSDYAFSGCIRLTETAIPNGITSIGGSAFASSGLQSVTFEENSALTEIGARAFAECSILQINIPASVLSVGGEAFYRNPLEKVTFAEGSVLQSIGASAFEYCKGLEEILLPGQLLEISDKAFSSTGLKQITIPASVKKLGDGVFAFCENLPAVTVEDGNTVYRDENGVVYAIDNKSIHTYPAGREDSSYALLDTTETVLPWAFAGANNLTGVTLPECLVQISEYGFAYMDGLQSMQIPDNVMQIGRFAFAEDWKLASVTFGVNSKLPRISFGAFSYSGLTSFTVPANVSTMAQKAFEGCSKLTQVTFAENSKLESISAYMFNGCSNLKTITFKPGSALTSIQAHGLEGMDKLTSIDFGDAKLTNVDNFAFRFCESLSSLSLPKTVISIGRYAFYGCKSMSELTVPTQVEHIGSYAFLGTKDLDLYLVSENMPAYLDENWDHGIRDYYVGVSSVSTQGDYKYAVLPSGNIAILDYLGSDTHVDLTKVSLGGSITQIGGSAFQDSTVQTVVLPETLTSIQAEAFAYSDLTEVTVPANVNFIGREAFAYTDIATLNFAAGAKLATVEQYAFQGTEMLTSVTIPASVTTLGTGVFQESGLQSVTFVSGIQLSEIPQKAFANSKLTAVTLPDSVTLVNHNAFSNVETLKSLSFGSNDGIRLMSNAFYNTGLTALHIPANVTYIGEYCFVGLSDLTSITVDAANPNYASQDGLLLSKDLRKLITVPSGRTGSLTVPQSVESLGFGCFEQSKLSAVSFAADTNLLTIGYRAFFQAENLTSIAVPKSVVSIDHYAFAYCEQLHTVTFAEGNKLTGVYEGAFCGDISLENITLPATIVEISDFAFYGCSKLSKLPVADTDQLKGIYDYAFAYTGISGEFSTPETLIDIGNYAFLGTKITKLTIPDTNKKDLIIGIGAFEGCYQMTEITLPFIGASYEDDEISWLGYIFGAGGYEANDTYVPESLKTVTITEGIQEVGVGAFYKIKSVEILNLPTSVSVIYDHSFTQSSMKYELSSVITWKTENGAVSDTVGPFGAGLSGTVRIADGVTNIGSAAFAECVNLHEVILPDSVKHIGNSAFRGCTSLHHIDLPDGLEMLDTACFMDSGIKRIVIPDGVTTIGWRSFFGCNNLSEIDLGDGICSIEGEAFHGCESLLRIVLSKELTSIDERAFESCKNLYEVQNNSSLDLTLGSSDHGHVAYAAKILIDREGNKTYYDEIERMLIETPDGFVFQKNGEEYLLTAYIGDETAITLPESINGCSYSLYNFSGGVDVTIPDSITRLPACAFYTSKTLRSVYIPDSVTYISHMAFAHCTNLASVRLPENGVTIGYFAFSYSGLEELYIPSGVIMPEQYAFADCTSLRTVRVAEDVTKIGEAAFEDCSALETVELPGSLEQIGKAAFHNCTSLSTLVLPEGLQTIGANAFMGCGALTQVGIPQSVTTIGAAAFSGNTEVILARSDNFSALDGILYNKDLTQIVYVTGIIPEELILPDTLTSISSYAFSDCIKLKSIVIPDSVTEIGSYAFSGCSNLDRVVMGDGVTQVGMAAFEYCSSLSSVTIPDSVTSIGGYAFSCCDGLTSITIPDSVTSIGNFAFQGCSGLTSVTIPDGVISIGDFTFQGCKGLTSVTIPDSVTSIGGYAFYYCDGLTSINIPDNVTSIGEYAFFYCDSLTSITIPDSVTSIGDGAFEYCGNLIYIVNRSALQMECGSEEHGYIACYALIIRDMQGNTTYRDDTYFETDDHFLFSHCNDEYTLRAYLGTEDTITLPANINGSVYSMNCFKGARHVIIPDGMTSINDYAFQNCNSLMSITIPDSVTSIGSSAFSGCTSLTSVTIPDSVTIIGDSAFENCRSLTMITIPDGVTSIGSSAFSGCTSLTSVAIPDGVTSIGDYAFVGCSSLTSVTIPDSVTSISGAFSGCSGLTSVTIPDSVTSISSDAFSGCSSLRSITIPDSVTSIGEGVFSGCIGLYNNPDYYQNGMLIVDDWLLDVDSNMKYFPVLSNIDGVAFSAYNGCDSLKAAVWGDAAMPSNVETLYITDINSGTPSIQDLLTLKSIVICDSVGISDLRYCRDIFYYVSGKTIYVEENEADLRWNENFPGWNNGNVVIYGDKWSNVNFYDADATLLYSEPKRSAEIIRRPVVEERQEEGVVYTFLGWDLDGDGVVDSVPATTAVDINAYAIYERHEHSYTSTVKAPNCTEDGFTTHTCACGDSYVTDYVSALAHSWDNGIITTEPGETTPGIRTYTCGTCGETKTVEVPPVGHVHNYGSIVIHPTCTEQGYTKYSCSCGDSYITNIKNPIGHTFTQWIVTQEPDEDRPGIKTRVCFCGYKENEQLLNPFQDVANGKYFSKPVFWAYENGITTGKTATTFELDADCTRKQIVTFLWRAAGKPEPQNMDIPFVDVKQDQFTKAILWAAEQGITSGTGDGTTFSPEQTCTRKQIVMFLWRFNGKPAPQSTNNPFTDVKQDQFTNAILWAFEQGITTGKTATTFEPESTCTRGQIVTFLYRDMVE